MTAGWLICRIISQAIIDATIKARPLQCGLAYLLIVFIGRLKMPGINQLPEFSQALFFMLVYRYTIALMLEKPKMTTEVAAAIS